MRTGRTIIMASALVMLLTSAGAAAPKVDPELTARLASAQSVAQLGVILTFDTDRITDAQVGQVNALGITTGVRMRNFPIMAVNATPAQVRALMNLNGLRSIYLNAPVQLYLDQSKPLIGVDRLLKDVDLTRRNNGVPFSGKGVTIAINDSGVDGSHQDLAFNPLDPTSKTVQNVIVNPSDKDGLVIRTNGTGNVVDGNLRVWLAVMQEKSNCKKTATNYATGRGILRLTS